MHWFSFVHSDFHSGVAIVGLFFLSLLCLACSDSSKRRGPKVKACTSIYRFLSERDFFLCMCVNVPVTRKYNSFSGVCLAKTSSVN